MSSGIGSIWGSGIGRFFLFLSQRLVEFGRFSNLEVDSKLLPYSGETRIVNHTSLFSSKHACVILTSISLLVFDNKHFGLLGMTATLPLPMS